MKTQIRSLLTLLCAASATLLILGSPAQAGYIVTLEQVGPNVVATGSGAIDLTGLSFVASGSGFLAQMSPGVAFIQTGPTAASASVYQTSVLSGPTSFGSGGLTFASSGTGDFVGIYQPTRLLYVPDGYASDSALSDTATYDSTNFSMLGVDPGTYEWTWGMGENQNFTLIIGPVSVPDRGSTFGLLAVSLIALLSATRLRSLRSA